MGSPSAVEDDQTLAKLTQPDSTKALMMAPRMQKQPPPTLVTPVSGTLTAGCSGPKGLSPSFKPSDCKLPRS